MNLFVRKIGFCSWGRTLLVFLCILLIVFTVLPNLINFSETTENILINQRKLNIKHTESEEGPNVGYEKLRRRIATNFKEFWFSVKSEIMEVQKQAQNKTPGLIKPLNHILDVGAQHKWVLLKDINSLPEVDKYEAWRIKEANSLSDLVQRRLNFLQNPSNCTNARKLICNLDSGGCGFGCTLHHVVNCLLVAYGTERTLILKSKGWRYHKAGWEDLFKPLSDTCTDPVGRSQSSWPGKSDTQVITLPLTYSMSPRPPYLPLAIPEDLAPRLIRLHSDPFLWWVGQLLKYLWRPQPDTSKFINESISKMGFKRPYVGVQIRRTDKLKREASFHDLDEYMVAVEEYYNQLDLTQGTTTERRIYLASDDPTVFTEMKKKYPQYKVLGNQTIAKTAAVSARYSNASSVRGIILDIHLLSISDYLVCTFSSNVCRLAYEIMQNFYPDGSSRFHSLDTIYYYAGGNSHQHKQVAVIGHKPERQHEIELNVGDQVVIQNNQWDGYSKGTNLRTNKVGLYPGFKVENKPEVVKFPTYPEVPLTLETSDDG